jgi:LysM repeat protein
MHPPVDFPRRTRGYSRPAMAHLSPARFLAPLALIAVGAGVVVVVQKETHHSATPAQTTTSTKTQQHRHKAKRPRTYVIKPGDNLSSIAQRARVSLATLQKLNPDIDPQALHTGQRLKLTR